ncbi:MAG: membrane protein insertion efficiency factor YidD [Pseudomonadota bacterium]
MTQQLTPKRDSSVRLSAGWAGSFVRGVVKAPIHIYRWTFKPFFGWHCRHLPTCSEYSLEAIDTHGAWRGGWLMASRLCRCNPYGTAGYDPVPDLSCEHHPLAPWRYGRWTGADIEQPWTEQVGPPPNSERHAADQQNN